jgi:hypothetical protein
VPSDMLEDLNRAKIVHYQLSCVQTSRTNRTVQGRTPAS